MLKFFLSIVMVMFMLHAETIESNVSDVKSFEGTIHQIAYDGNTAFILQGNEVKSYQVASDGSLTLLDTIKAPKESRDAKIYISEGKLFIFGWDGGFIVDTSNPSSLKLLNPNTATYASTIIQENTIFTLDSNELKIIDANNSEYPIELSRIYIPTINWANTVKLSRNYLIALGDGNYNEESNTTTQHIAFIDISNPSSPHIAGGYDYNTSGDNWSNRIASMTATNDKLFLYVDGDIVTLDISDINNITQLASLHITDYYNYWGYLDDILIAKENRLYLNFEEGYNATKTYIYNIDTNGTLSALNTTGELNFGTLDTNNHKLITAKNDGLYVYDVDNTSNIQELAYLPSIEYIYNIIKNDDQLFVSGHSNTITVYNNSNPDNPIFEKTIAIEPDDNNNTYYNYVRDIYIDNNLSYILHGNLISIYDIEDLDNVVKLSDYSSNGFNPSGITKAGSYIYAIDAGMHLNILDVNDSSNPQLTGSLDINISNDPNAYPWPILIKATDNYLYLCEYTEPMHNGSEGRNYLKIVNISNKNNPLLVASYDINQSDCWEHAYYNKKIYLPDSSSSNLVVLDVNDTSNIYMNTIDINGTNNYINSIKITNDKLYISLDDYSSYPSKSRLNVYDLNSSTINSPSKIYNLDSSLVLSEISDPYVYSKSYSTGGWSIIKLTGDKMSITDDSDGDGYSDDEDAFPNDPTEWKDTDGDGWGNNNDLDDDDDGILDEDEIRYGLNPQDPSDANEDADGDGFSNIDEIDAHTNPNDPNDHPDSGNNNNDNNNNEKSFKGDFNGDGVNDVLVYRKTDGNLYVLIVSNDGSSSTFRKIFSKFTLDKWNPINAADYNGDGADDILVQRKIDGNLYTLILNSDGTTTINKIRSHFSSDNWEILTTSNSKKSDFNGDGKIDILVRRKSDGNIYALISNNVGTQSTIKKMANHLDSDTWKIIDTADFNGDGNSDILVYRRTDGNLYTLLSNSNGTSTFKKIMSGASEDNWEFITIADYNNDNKADIALQRTTDGNLYTVMLDSNGNYKLHKIASNLSDENSWEIYNKDVDFNGDENSDILAFRENDGNLYSLIVNNNGTTATFKKLMSHLTPDTWDITETADFNGDGNSDILIHRIEDGNVYTLLINSDGTTTLKKAMSGAIEDNWKFIYTADFNNDGKSDILLQRVTDGNLYTLILDSNGNYKLHKIASRLASDSWYIAK